MHYGLEVCNDGKVMYSIKKYFDDYHRPNNRGILVLNYDKEISHEKIDFPITWAGKLNGQEVKIIMNQSPPCSNDSYVFDVFPREYEDMKQEIIGWIEEKIDLITK